MSNKGITGHFKSNEEKGEDVRISNIKNAKALADAIRTSLGPRGMDKMIQSPQGDVIITNDGATILKQMEVLHPTAKMLVDLSKSQDIECGDGTTSVVVMAGALLQCALDLLERGIHPTVISEGFNSALDFSLGILDGMSIPVDLNDRETLLNATITSLSSKVVSYNSSTLAPIAVDTVLSILPLQINENVVDLRDIKIVKKMGGTIDDSTIQDGVVFTSPKTNINKGGPSKVATPKIGLIQFCLTAPKTDLDNNIVVNDQQTMDRILNEEKKYIIQMCKKVAQTGCNVLMIQKSILRDATNDLVLHFLTKLKILVIKDVDRNDIEFISKTLGVTPVASIDQFTKDKLGTAAVVEEVALAEGKDKVLTLLRSKPETRINEDGNEESQYIKSSTGTMTVLLRGSNQLIIEEADRSLHDAMCVVRSLVKKRSMLYGGSAPEMEVCVKLREQARKTEGVESMILKAQSDALELIPFTLAENAGLNPINIVTELRNRHLKGEKHAGISIKHQDVRNIAEENVIQPSLVTTNALTLATECVRMILKIDDIVMTR